MNTNSNKATHEKGTDSTITYKDFTNKKVKNCTNSTIKITDSYSKHGKSKKYFTAFNGQTPNPDLANFCLLLQRSFFYYAHRPICNIYRSRKTLFSADCQGLSP